MLLTATELEQLDTSIDAPITAITANYVRARQLLDAAKKMREHSNKLAEMVVALQEENQALRNELRSCSVNLESCKKTQRGAVGSWRDDAGMVDRNGID